jgi:beta-lactam-binding protein with PASTA domain
MPATRLPSSQPRVTGRRQFRSRVWGAGRLMFLIVALSITFGAFFLTGMRVANKAREVRVPDIKGQSVADATRSLAIVGLVLKVESKRPDSAVPADHVLLQEPDPGRILRRQRAVRVRISEGLRAPAVPAFVGQAERTADLMLTQDNLTVTDRAEIRSTRYPSGTVVAQDPAPDGRSSKVSLLINKGESSVRYVMPDVIGTVAGRVVDILRRRGFRVTVGAEVPYPGVPSGVVIRQTPQAGFQVDYGDAIVLEVSR